MNDEFRLVKCDAQGAPLEAIGPLGIVLEESCRQTAELYARIGYVAPWVGYLAISGTTPVGGGAFVGAPKAGKVEIAYFTLPEFGRRGFASATAIKLVEIARNADPGVALIAKTLPEENASTRILRKCGFEFAGETTDDDVGLAWLWTLPLRER